MPIKILVYRSIAANILNESKNREWQFSQLQNKLSMTILKAEALKQSMNSYERYHKVAQYEFDKGLNSSSDVIQAVEGLTALQLKNLDLRLEWSKWNLQLKYLTELELNVDSTQR